MKPFLVPVAAVAILAVAVSFFCVERRSPTHHASPTANAEGTKLLARLPIAFVPNLGQWEHPARFVARIGAMTVFLEEQGWTFTLVERSKAKEDEAARGVAVRMSFAGASEPQLVTEDPLPGRHNYFLGNDPAKWRSGVPLYRSVRYRGMHRGVDVRARGQDGHFEYDLLLQPGADLDPVEVAVEGIDGMHLDRDGALVLGTRVGPVRMPAPMSWEEGPAGARSPITCRYVLRGRDRFGFQAPGRRPGWALVVDPGLVWSTYLGGTSDDGPSGIALDAQGAPTVSGGTASIAFPTTPGAFDTTRDGSSDAFVTRLSPTGGSLVYSTFLGGTGSETSSAIALDAQGAATVSGTTLSTDFPTTPGAFDTSYNGGAVHGDVFVARLSPTGASLAYSTFLGATGDETSFAMALDAQGTATVVGYTQSSAFPTTPGAFDTSFNGLNDGFVTRLSATGASLVYSTFLGGTSGDIPTAIAVDAQGAATVSGNTGSTGFPTTPGAFDTSPNGGDDVFVTRLSATGASLVYSTFLGGMNNEWCPALAVDAQGAVTVAGRTESANFPTTPGAFDTSISGTADAFVTRLSPTGSGLVYSTFLGGTTHWDRVLNLVLDAQGAATVAGSTSSSDFPTTPGAFDTSISGTTDAFVTRLSPTGTSLVYSTLLGGTSGEWAQGLGLGAQGAATVAGWTNSIDFPTTPGAFDNSLAGGGVFSGDVFVTRLDMLPTGVAAFGNSSHGCTGPLVMSVTSMPWVGNASFSLTCGNAAPSSLGLIAFSRQALPAPFPVLGVEIWIDPSSLLLTATVISNSIGASEVPMPIPGDPTFAGTRFFTQFLWLGPAAPPPCPPQGFSASNALDFTIQP